ncbi:MAG: hypothetical protein ACK5MD_02470 [Flavobacteriales bacterium]
MRNTKKWKSLNCIVKIDSKRHQGIENSLHWVLDVAFGEDKSRKQDGHVAQNFSMIKDSLEFIKE